MLRDCFLVQHVTEATYNPPDKKPSTIDLVFSNEEGMVESLRHDAPLGKSHHCSLLFDFVCYCDKKIAGPAKPQFSKGNYDKLKEKMASYNWVEDFVGKSCEECWAILEERMRKGIDDYIPKKKSYVTKPGKPLWMKESALKKVKKKAHAYKRYLETREGKDYQAYAQARNQARWETRKLRRELEKSIAKESKNNPKAFYQYANSRLKTRTGIGNLDTAQGKVSSDKEKAQTLNEFFTSVFTRENTDDIPDLEPEREIQVPLDDLKIDSSDIRIS